jgi:pimeloyl-ACP methyl ester carboxylesterase
MSYANAGIVRLYYESTGEGTPFILHAHHHLAYMPFQTPYFSQFYRVITFDRRGTGRSDDPPGPWTPADLAADIRNLMDALAIGKAIVGGISLGGVVSSQFGLDYPDRVHALIVGGTVPHLWPLGEEWLDQQIAAAEGRAPVIVNQPRSYDWEEAGPPTQAPDFADSQFGRYFATLDISGLAIPSCNVSTSPSSSSSAATNRRRQSSSPTSGRGNSNVANSSSSPTPTTAPAARIRSAGMPPSTPSSNATACKAARRQGGRVTASLLRSHAGSGRALLAASPPHGATARSTRRKFSR